MVEEARRPSAQELADARKLLEQLLAPCEGADAHSWRKCKRCAAVHGIEMRFSLSMRLLRALLASQEAAPSAQPEKPDRPCAFYDPGNDCPISGLPRWEWCQPCKDYVAKRQEGSPR